MSKPPSPILESRKTPLDMLVLYGMPILFFAIAWWGITSLLGPAPPPKPVNLIRDGAAQPGMLIDRVVEKVGVPKSIETYPDGTQGYVYHQGTAEPFVEEEATVVVSENGVVLRVAIEKVTVPQPPADSSK